MAAIITEAFEGGTNGAAVTTGNTSIGAIGAGAAWTFTNASPVAPSTLACRATFSASTSNARWTLPTSSTAYFDLFIRSSEVASARSVAWVASDLAARASVRILADGTVQIRNGNVEVARTTATVAANAWFRVAWKLVNGTEQRLRLYATAPYTAVTEEISGTFNTGSFDRFRIGADASLTGTTDWDSLISDDTTWPTRGSGGAGQVTYNLTAEYDQASPPDLQRWVLDATDSVGTVTVAQSAGTTATIVESPTGVFTVTNPGGSDTLVLTVTAGSDVEQVTLLRGATMQRPALWVFQGGDPTDISNWR